LSAVFEHLGGESRGKGGRVAREWGSWIDGVVDC
jgi:hypothetical protein